jgi:glycosyltransferase involved in cell wall biosynthesis
VHFPHFNVPLLYNEPFVVTIHDLLWHDRVGFSTTTLPKWLYLIKYLGYRAVLKHAVLKSKAIIVPSKWVKKKVAERFPEAEGKINVIYEGVSDIFRGVSLPRQGDSSLEIFKGRTLPYIIYTGSLYPHKNVAAILNVLRNFSDLKLVVACARSVFRQRFEIEIEKRKLRDKVIFAGFVSDEDLAVLYKKAVALVLPSLSEGFGLPGLEAMAAGCPVLSSTSGALPEIYADAAIYFDPKNEAELIEKIREIKENREYRKKMIELGKDRARMFSWEKCAEETMDVYKEILSKKQ